MHISNKYLIESIVFVSYILFAMAWVGGTASMSNIMSAMSVDSLADASFISGAVTLAKILGTFIAALLALKLGLKNALLLSMVLIAVGVLTPLSPNYYLLLLSRFIMGLGGALMIVYFNPVVMRCFSARERPVVNGLNAVAFNIGTAIILYLMADINAFTGGWRSSLMLFSLASLLLGVIWMLVKFEQEQSASDNHSQTSPQADYSYRHALKDKFNWVYSLTYAGLLSFYICLFTFYPRAGISQSALVITFGILGTLAGIIYSLKFPRRLPVIRWSGLVMVITIIGLTFSPSITVKTICAMVLGFVIFFPITALVSLPQELPQMTSEKITIVFSLFWSISYLMTTLVLWLFGKLVDVNQGDFSQAFILITLVSSSFFIGSFFLPEPAKVKQ
ncbi:MFS transporter [Thalassomonas actiniarum]|uniref:MFS transporter n=1 Tax=Thalassomonas actiniarum TaxID=485447 RepID=A0AAE9YTY2_9GAMM|nr:MFS transporter [Thalassomonas actiniarum]WDE00697.1 MFS transporter [Thalassomonas actiniarum]